MRYTCRACLSSWNMLYIYNISIALYNFMPYIQYMKPRRIYNRIAMLRSERGTSRKELAEVIGVNFQTVGYLEREEYNPSLDLAMRISDYFELPITLIFATEPMRPLSQELLEHRSREGQKP